MRLDDQIGRGRGSAEQRATIRFVVAAYGSAGAQEVFEDALFHQVQRGRRNAFVIHFGVAEQGKRGIVGHVEHFRHDADAAAAFEFGRDCLRRRADELAGDVEIVSENLGQ